MAVNTCVRNMEPLSLPSNPLPSGLLLQGGRGSSHSSSDLSSTEGVWPVRKLKKMKENAREKHEASPGSFPNFNE